MSRALIDYTARRDTGPYQGFDADVPVSGHYRIRLRSGAVYVGVRIWFGAPLDPVDGSELDRAPRWQAVANEESIPLPRVWPKCADEPIDAGEYRYLCGVNAWAKENAPDSPQANPMQRINPLTAPTPF